MKKIIKYVKKHPGCNSEDIYKELGKEYGPILSALIKDGTIISTIDGNTITYDKPYNYCQLYISASKEKTKQISWAAWINAIVNAIKLIVSFFV